MTIADLRKELERIDNCGDRHDETVSDVEGRLESKINAIVEYLAAKETA
jgi:hypothetical protein